MADKDKNDNVLNMRVASRRASANIAVSESPFSAFRQTTLTLNGKIFSEVNDYRRILDTCYQGTGPASYGDNHSLKPCVIRNTRPSDAEANIPVMIDDHGTWRRVTAGGHDELVMDRYVERKTLDHAFSILEHNGPFLERARIFQDELDSTGKTWEGLITSYLEVGPFQARARKGNTAVPFVRDFHLLLNFLSNESSFDSVAGTSAGIKKLGVVKSRTVPGKLFEYANKNPEEDINRIIMGML